ncbi:MAG: septum formation initiator family protein [Alphaproteobacteria bacterium]|nr:septum formation initiator family protein [Alphaproteobacteria bacterium]
MVATDIKRRARHMVGPMLGCLLVAYFVYHSIQGDHGAVAWRQLDMLITEAETSLESLDSQRGALERRVKMLRPDSLDADLVEEQGRRLLNFSHPDDVVLVPQQN